MSILLSKNINFLYNYPKYIYTKLPTKCFSNVTRINKKHSNKQAPNLSTDIRTFQENIAFHKNEASRSILVQVQSAQSYKELHNYCSAFGTVKNMLHYSTGVEPMHFIIVEFSCEDEVKTALSASSYLEDTQAVPVHTQFLWFRASHNRMAKVPKTTSKNIQLLIQNGQSIIKDTEIQEILRNANSISEQMFKLHEFTKLNDVGIRLRYLVAKQIEMAVAGMFPSATALPFGSSVNGYGKMGCDLDVVLKLNHKLPCINEETRLVFHSKAMLGSERTTSQRHMEAIGDILQLFLPGCSQVRRILQARVPIIKYYQQLADIECDLSLSNTSGVHMSDFLYLMGSIDERVRPLVFTIRRWAAETGITNSSPGRWISNFSLTLMVIAFLQSCSTPILPLLNKLVSMAGEEDKFIAEDGLNCTFLRSHTKYLSSNPTTNTDDLKTLLQKFFEFYSSFDFQNKAISLNEGVPHTKPEHCALYIVNPLERGLNVSKNVSIEELEKFRGEVRNAAWILESEENPSNSWGLLQLFTTKKTSISNNYSNKMYYNRHSKLIEVSKLFEDDDIEYKNDDVKKQVHNIRQERKDQIKNLKYDLNSQKSGR